MNRCVPPDRFPRSCDMAVTARETATSRRAVLRRLLAGTGAAALALLAAAPARAGLRQFPMNTRRGQITFVNSAQVVIDGQTAQIGPGTRIHDALSNRLLFASRLQGQTFTANYVDNGYGTIREIWILTPEEIQEKLPPTQEELNLQRQSQNVAPPQMLN